MTRINTHSNYWIGNLTGSADMWWREDIEDVKPGKDIIALAGYRRAIANFVNIVTNRTDIPVTYNANDESFTDGKKVYLSGNMNEKNFDPNVGLALHEGSHIVHTDFDLLNEISARVASYFKIPEAQDLDFRDPGMKLITTRVERIKNLFNWVEDRRIDYLTFKSAPGYKNYYHAMYNKYFHFNIIDKALKSSEHRLQDWDSYIFRIINFTNKNSDLDALPGLRKIYKIINIKNIARLNSSEDALNVAMRIYEEVLKHLGYHELSTSDDGEDQKSNSHNDDGSAGDEGTEIDTGNNEMTAGEGNSTNDIPELTEAQKKSLDKAINKQKELIQGKSRKTKLTKSDSSQLKSVEDSGAYNVEVGAGIQGAKVHCSVIPKITDAMVEAARNWTNRRFFPFLYHREHEIDRMTEVIGRGISLGKKLGKKLEIRNEERSTKWTRQNSGRIDKRLIAELGFDNENIFKTTFIEKYNDAYMHISIDGSGSMSGINFDNALKSTVAICQAASMAGNIHVQVSLRVTSDTNRVTKPLIVFLYDSKINGIIHIKKFWKYLGVSGTTPEGLCFEAIMDQIIKDAAGRDAFFLNYSDGQPVFHSKDFSYVGTTAYNHTRKEVDKLRAAGIKVMSFFISDDRWNSYSADITPFKTMYGKDAVKIDPTALVPLAKEINKKFLQK
jgi:hypothetical protein